MHGTTGNSRIFDMEDILVYLKDKIRLVEDDLSKREVSTLDESFIDAYCNFKHILRVLLKNIVLLENIVTDPNFTLPIVSEFRIYFYRPDQIENLVKSIDGLDFDDGVIIYNEIGVLIHPVFVIDDYLGETFIGYLSGDLSEVFDSVNDGIISESDRESVSPLLESRIHPKI